MTDVVVVIVAAAVVADFATVENEQDWYWRIDDGVAAVLANAPAEVA